MKIKKHNYKSVTFKYFMPTFYLHVILNLYTKNLNYSNNNFMLLFIFNREFKTT